MKVKRSQIGWGFWLWWVLITTVGWFAGFIMGFVLGMIIVEGVIGTSVLGFTLGYFMFGASLGSVVSLLQWLVLRRCLSKVGWWILTSTAVFALVGVGGYGAGVVVFGYEGLAEVGGFTVVFGWTMVAALAGAMTGILQWLILRSQVSRAGWWVLASTVGWGLSMAAVVAYIALEYAWGTPALTLLIGSGAVLGAVTGGALVWLLRQPVPEV